MASEIALPGLVESEVVESFAITVRRKRPEDAVAQRARPSEPPLPLDSAALRIRRWQDGGWHHLRYGYRDHFAAFEVRRDGAEVRVHASAEVPDSDLASLLEGVVLGGAMRLLGSAGLHATVITDKGRAIALMGPSGAGKSSLAWALVQQGRRLLSDDFASLRVSTDGYLVRPGRTKLRLWPDTVKRLAVEAALVAPLFPSVTELEKLVVTDPGATDTNPTPLHAIYLLNPRNAALDEPHIEDMPLAERLAVLAANIYGSFAPDVEIRRSELAALAKVARSVRVCGLTLPDRLDALPEMAERLGGRLFA